MSFTLPDDAVNRLGNGNPKTAGAVLRRLFGVNPQTPTTIHPDVVRALGGGDISTGYRVLQKFAQLLRQAGGYSYERIPTRYASGGKVKSTKAKENYRPGVGTLKCQHCTMFRPPHSCTAIEGHVEAAGLCDLFKHRPRGT